MIAGQCVLKKKSRDFRCGFGMLSWKGPTVRFLCIFGDVDDLMSDVQLDKNMKKNITENPCPTAGGVFWLFFYASAKLC